MAKRPGKRERERAKLLREQANKFFRGSVTDESPLGKVRFTASLPVLKPVHTIKTVEGVDCVNGKWQKVTFSKTVVTLEPSREYREVVHDREQTHEEPVIQGTRSGNIVKRRLGSAVQPHRHVRLVQNIKGKLVPLIRDTTAARAILPKTLVGGQDKLIYPDDDTKPLSTTKRYTGEEHARQRELAAWAVLDSEHRAIAQFVFFSLSKD